MKLCLSSDALPDGTPEQLIQACNRRALHGLELTLGADHRHGLDETICPIKQHEGQPCFPEGEPPVEWLHLPEVSSATTPMIWAGGAHQLDAGLLLHNPIDPPLATPVALVHPTDEKAARDAATWARQHDAYTAWSIRPAVHTPGDIQRILDLTGPTLAHVRLLGGGPAAEASDDAGTGALMSKLALAGYRGTVALAPSADADLARWRRWLLDERGWGCNTAAIKKDRTQSCCH